MSNKITFGIQNIFSLASRERCITNLKKIQIPKFKSPPSKRTAAVLVPVCRVDNIPSLIYTVRSSDLRNHGGQISFPGGKTDENETPIETALRETEEEIGIPSKNIDVWGHGPAFPGRRDISITPVIGTILNLRQEEFKLSEEVAEIFSVPIEVLCDPKNHYYTQFKNGYILPVFIAEQYRIWGITAIITDRFLACALSKDVYRNEWYKKKIVLDKPMVQIMQN